MKLTIEQLNELYAQAKEYHSTIKSEMYRAEGKVQLLFDLIREEEKNIKQKEERAKKRAKKSPKE